MKRIIIFLFGFSVIFVDLFSQITFTSYTNLNDVKCQLEVGDNIWFGGTGGISIRDKSTGSMVASYTSNDGLPNNNVIDMAKDIAGNVWVVTGLGLSKFDGQEWHTFTKEESGLGGGILQNLNCVEIDHQSNVWFGTTGWNVYKYDGETFERKTSINDTVYDIAISSAGNIWFATNNYAFIFANNKSYHITNFADKVINKIAVDQNDSIWVSYKNIQGLSRFHPSASPLSKLYLPGETIAGISIDDEGKIWIGTGDGNNGIIIKTHDIPASINYQDHDAVADTLISSGVYAITHDAQGNVWIGTREGVTRFKGKTPENSVNYFNNNTLSGNEVRDIAISQTGKLFFATNYGLTIKNGPTWENYTSPDIPHIDVTTLEEFNNGLLWIGTAKGAQVMKMSDNTLYPSVLGGTRINDILFYHDTTYFATPNGLFRRIGVSEVNYTTADGLLSNTVFSLEMDSAGILWIGTPNGISKFDGANFIDALTVGEGEIPFNRINTIAFDSAGIAWLGTPEGLVVLDGSPYTVYNKSNSGLSGNKVGNIKFGGTGMAWIGTKGGLNIFNGEKWANYYLEDGLPGNNINALYRKNGDNSVWIGTKYGAAETKFWTPKAGYTYDTICYSLSNQNTKIKLEAQNVDSVSSIKWDLLNDGTIDYTGWEVNHNFGGHGKFDVKQIVKSYNRSDTLTGYVLVGSEPDPRVAPGNLKICDGEEIFLHAEILNYSDVFNYDFIWSNGETTSKIKIAETDTFSVTVSANKCMGTSPESTVEVVKPYDSLEICLVTVDSVSGKNKIMWERPNRDDIVSFVVYKVLGTNFIPVGEVLWDEMTMFTDFQSTPANVSARYALTVIDTCGNESELSPYHQTIHLTASVGATQGTYQLIWNHYEDESGNFEPDFYYILRGNNASDLNQVAQVDGINTSYTDDNPTEERFYKIAISKPQGSWCSPSDTKDKKANSGPFSRSLSNLEDNRQQGTDILEIRNRKIEIFPNPMTTSTTISTGNNQIYSLKVYDLAGKLMVQKNDVQGPEILLERNALESGIYILELLGKQRQLEKLIVN